MSHSLPKYKPFELRGEELREAIMRYATNPIYRQRGVGERR